MMTAEVTAFFMTRVGKLAGYVSRAPKWSSLLGVAALLCAAPPLCGEEPIEYPYQAAPARAERIQKQIGEVKVGMSADEVIRLLGAPVRVTPLLEARHKNGKQIGYTYWYLISQQKEFGSVVEVRRNGYGIRMNLNREVTRVDRFEPPKVFPDRFGPK